MGKHLRATGKTGNRGPQMDTLSTETDSQGLQEPQSHPAWVPGSLPGAAADILRKRAYHLQAGLSLPQHSGHLELEDI